MTDRTQAARIFREEAVREGFSRVGIARAGEPPGFSRFEDWIASGRHAGMRYLEETAAVRSRPAELLPNARSVVCLAALHARRAPRTPDGSKVARYAVGDDYHGTIRKRAVRAAGAAAARIGGAISWRVCVDSTPIAERAFAAAAGLGWIGKNGCLIDRELGSYLLLAEIVTDLDLPVDDPVAEMCGSCVRCLEACPTGAFVAPAVLDANRCIAYWTIEHRGPIPDDVKPHLAEHVFGCDVCQEVCPWNGPRSLPSAPAGVREGSPLADRNVPAATAGRVPAKRAAGGVGGEGVEPTSMPGRAEWLAMGKGEFRRRFGATAFNRAGRRGLQRNAAISAVAAGDETVASQLPRVAGATDRGLSDAVRWAAVRHGAMERTT